MVMPKDSRSRENKLQRSRRKSSRISSNWCPWFLSRQHRWMALMRKASHGTSIVWRIYLKLELLLIKKAGKAKPNNNIKKWLKVANAKYVRSITSSSGALRYSNSRCWSKTNREKDEHFATWPWNNYIKQKLYSIALENIEFTARY